MKKFLLTALFLAGSISASFAIAQTDAQTDSDPPYGMTPLEAYSLFLDNYNSGEYEIALTFGEWMLEARPRQIQGHPSFTLDTQFRRFIRIYESLGDEESDPSEKTRWFNKALNVFDIVEETYGEEDYDEFDWLIRKGTFYQNNHRDLDQGLQRAYELYETAYELDHERFVERGGGYFAQILLQSYVSTGEQDKALAMIDVIEPLAGLELQNQIEEAREQLFQEPEERIAFIEGRLDQVEDRELALMELAELYIEIGDRDSAFEITLELYELNPNFENTRTLADRALSNAEYETAIRYLKEALELSPDNEHSKRIALEIAENFQNLDDLRSAREYARQALEYDSNYGEAYMRIASIYAAAVTECTSGRSIERDDKTVYWLVADYLEKAKEVSPELTSRANRQIESYKPVMPTTQEKFFRDWNEGDSFQIDGSIGECYAWINETTTVR